MKLREFEDLAREYWEEIPEEYKRGIDGVRVLRRSKAHDELADVYTMGECLTEAYPSDFGGPDTTRSAVVLYHGSFAALAQVDDAFDWEEELWETLTHELQHHLESLANEAALEDVDYAADENFKRYDGQEFDPHFYRAGHEVSGPEMPWLDVGAAEPVALSGWRVEGDWFFELPNAPGVRSAARVTLEWMGARHSFIVPASRADVTIAILGGGFVPPRIPHRRVDEVVLVIARRVSWAEALLTLVRPHLPTVEEVDVDATSTQAPA